MRLLTEDEIMRGYDLRLDVLKGRDGVNCNAQYRGMATCGAGLDSEGVLDRVSRLAERGAQSVRIFNNAADNLKLPRDKIESLVADIRGIGLNVTVDGE